MLDPPEARTGAPRRERALHAARGTRAARPTSSASRPRSSTTRLRSEHSGELDFVDRIAAPFPLGVIAWILGVPAGDWQHLFRWTNEVIGKDDPEYRRPGETPGQTIKRARGEVHALLPGA